jgi:hypothetical protein
MVIQAAYAARSRAVCLRTTRLCNPGIKRRHVNKSMELAWFVIRTLLRLHGIRRAIVFVHTRHNSAFHLLEEFGKPQHRW